MLAAGLGDGMRRFFVGVLGFSMIALSVACFGGGDNGNKYPDEVRKNFLKTCSESGGNDKQCNCAIEKLEAKYKLKEFQDLEKRITSGDATAETEIAPVVAACR